VSEVDERSWLTGLISHPLPVLLVFAGLFVFGIAALVNLPIASLPDVEYPMIQVGASYPGASAETMAATVAAPLERSLAGVMGVRLMTSSSSPDETDINLQFETDRDIDAAAVEVERALQNAAPDLPRDLPHPPGYSKAASSSDYSIFVVALTSPALSMARLSQLGEDVVLRRLAPLPGVGRVFIADQQLPAIRVLVDPVALAARNLTMDELRAAIARTTVAGPKGKLTGALQALPLASNDQVRDAEGVRQMIVAWRNGAPIRIQDIAQVENGREFEETAGWYNNIPAIIIGVQRRPAANVVKIVDQVKQALPDIRASLPPAVTLDVVTDRTTNTRAALDHLAATLGITILAVVAAIFIFVRHAGATLIPTLAIPASLLVTFIGMALLGYTIDNLSLMALAISVGFVVDDAIVVVENVIRRIEQGESRLKAITAGTRQVGFTILSITISLVAVFIPVLFIHGVLGKFFREFGAVVSLAVLVSGAVSVTLTPVLCLTLLGRAGHAGAQGGTGGLAHLYRHGLDWALKHRALVLLGFACVSAGTVALYSAVPKGFLPRQDMGTLNGFIDAPAGTSPDAMQARIRALVAVVQKDPAVVTVTAYQYRDGQGSMYINLKNRAQRDSADAVIARLRASALAVHGAQLYLQPNPELTLSVDSSPAEYAYTLSGSDFAELHRWAPDFVEEIRKLPFMRDVRSDLKPGAPQLTVQVDRPLAARLGVDAAAIDEALFAAFGQERAARLFDDATQRYIFVQFDRPFQRNEAALSLVHVRSSNGALVPLSAFVHLERTQSQPVIQHRDRLPVASISFNLAAGTPLSAAVEAIRGIERKLAIPSSIHGAFEGAAGEFERSLADEPWLIGAALLVVYLVLGVLYENAWHPLTILSSLPSAGAGALLAIYLLGGEFTLVSLIGILLLIGIVKKNAIMIVDFALEAERKEGLDPLAAIRKASLLRFRPIMMTTLAALVGSLPLALDGGPGAELRNPLGIAIAGGLLLSQLLTLFTTPVIYLALARPQSWLRGAPRASATYVLSSPSDHGTAT
jgi:hydrophobe/amphiphile efflux-1 (HAE1) family protein